MIFTKKTTLYIYIYISSESCYRKTQKEKPTYWPLRRSTTASYFFDSTAYSFPPDLTFSAAISLPLLLGLRVVPTLEAFSAAAAVVVVVSPFSQAVVWACMS